MQRPMQNKASNPSTPPQTSSSNWEQEDQSLTPVLHYTQTYKHHHKWSIVRGKQTAKGGKGQDTRTYEVDHEVPV